ncbi:hypothetical protein G6F42_016919 [Rhizopus arrhizus]|nr:hypothetical protein G6F42_016919 [Rhizopus arrhizus]
MPSASLQKDTNTAVYKHLAAVVNTRSPSPMVNQSPAPAPAPARAPVPAANVPANNQQNEIEQRRQQQLFLSNFIQKLCSFPADQLVTMLGHLKDNASNYQSTSAQDSARLKMFSEMNNNKKMQLLNLLHWKIMPAQPNQINTNQQQAVPPTLCFEQGQLDSIIAKKATIERITKQFDDENIYAAISLLSKGNVELFERLSDAELLKFFSDQSILRKLVVIFQDIDTQASGSTEVATIDDFPPVSSLVALISDSTVHENAVKLLELDKGFFQRDPEERVKKYLSVIDSIKSLKMYMRIMKRLSKSIPQLNSSQSPVQQPQQTTVHNNNTSSVSPAPQASTQSQPQALQSESQHPQLSFPLAHLGYPQTPPTNNK